MATSNSCPSQPGPGIDLGYVYSCSETLAFLWSALTAQISVRKEVLGQAAVYTGDPHQAFQQGSPLTDDKDTSVAFWYFLP